MFANEIDNAITTALEETFLGGGSTVSMTGAVVPKSGYMVGGVTEPMIVDLEFLNPDNGIVAWATLWRFVGEHFTILTKPGYFFGLWIDQATGSVYVDISEHIDSLETALNLAVDRSEISIWNLDNATEIRVKPVEEIANVSENN